MSEPEIQVSIDGKVFKDGDTIEAGIHQMMVVQRPLYLGNRAQRRACAKRKSHRWEEREYCSDPMTNVKSIIYACADCGEPKP